MVDAIRVASQPPAVRNTASVPVQRFSTPQPAEQITLPGSGADLPELAFPGLETRRFEAVKRASIANTKILGNQTFALFKDATGQYVTRYTNQDTGKVTYIPEPELLRRSGGNSPSVLIKA